MIVTDQNDGSVGGVCLIRTYLAKVNHRVNLNIIFEQVISNSG